jgi:hypothetical protein
MQQYTPYVPMYDRSPKLWGSVALVIKVSNATPKHGSTWRGNFLPERWKKCPPALYEIPDKRKVYAMKTYGGVHVQIHVFLTSALVGQARRSRVRIPMRSLDFSIHLILAGGHAVA